MADLPKDTSKPQRQKVSCIICAHNESDRISVILETLKDHPLIDEVIVIDDGSTDDTVKIVGSFPWVRLISYPKNMGKSSALAIGVRMARSEFLTLLDADLIGLTKEDITALIEPVLSGKADISISLRKNSLPVYKLMGLDFVSGERTLRKDFLEGYANEMAKLPGFSLEVFMNHLVIQHKLRVKTVDWPNVINPRKSKKTGFFKGTLGDVRMIVDILKVISPQDIILQNYRILALTVDR